MLRALATAAIVSFVIAASGAWAQTPSVTKPTAADKAAISKACSDQANAKNLHGKARKKFRAACKKNSGKA
jgi:hypothetical protein